MSEDLNTWAPILKVSTKPAFVVLIYYNLFFNTGSQRN